MPFPLAEELRRALDQHIPRLLAAATSEFGALGADSFFAPLPERLARGKRTRALAAACGWLAAGGDEDVTDPLFSIALALELYQLHALVHDDIIDHACTRRGLPALHVAYARTHAEAGWAGSGDDYGVASAILAGDYLLSAASDAAYAACINAPEAWARFALLTREVAVGQYLDVRAEHEPDPADALAAALGVLTHKSANYSVVHPVALGALVAGADTDLIATLDALTTPWGQAFQLRDDDLGVFGDPDLTGKPSGDDLREGKRTVLLALTLQRAAASERDWLLAQLRDGAWDDAAIDRARHLIIACGAREEHEARIRALVAEGDAILEDANLPDAGRDACRWLGSALVERDA
ncbi:polyprenyl synthetase family protein [Nanchangia anserum]|uniref:Polyprenyl synthetase family protein n=1 Tax=Nanchangia anserum TaxID=2692125 RepID=A0A8I0GB04_9ACTO|nr:polyprenyl synthetase family protein [Nanchangia anserum]MBD3688840.1 polyprenyl synthetase family protein [Nanchangia anserum]QOX81113.1 polyprenyl synthetase family protein [Nanchangia anserum]